MAARFPQRPALSHKKGDAFVDISFRELLDDVRVLATALERCGLVKGDRIAILAENGVDWTRTDLAALALGVVTVPIYPTLPPNQVSYVLQDSGAKAVFCGDRTQIAKVLRVRKECPALEMIAAFRDSPGGDVVSLDSLFEDGKAHAFDPADFESRSAAIRPDELLTLIYTSGTTGDPKGVELTHSNVMSVIEGCRDLIFWDENDIFLSLLPVSHVYERVAGYYLALAEGACIAYVEGNTMVEKLAKLPSNFQEVRPTIFIGMPRLYDKMKEKIEDTARKAGPAKARIFDWAVGVGRRVAYLTMRGRKPGPMLAARYKVADHLVFEKIRARLGGRIRYLVSGGAALDADVMEFYCAAGLTLIEGYGLTETTSVVAANRPGCMRPGSVGFTLHHTEARIAGDGELLVRGPGVMRRYWNKPADTEAVLEPDGWFHTGDTAAWMEGSFLQITGRKKDLIVLSNGKNVAPQNIEAKLMHSPIINDIVLMGDGAQSVVALIVPAFDRLEADFPGMTREQLTTSPEVKKRFRAEIDRLSVDLADFERVRRFAILDHEFSIEGGELTPSMKVRRHVLAQKYKDILAELTGQ
jgi:long-chain acyl-CoA synthetase